ncbi:Fe-S cluster assembly protein SufD [Bradyrhizobium mercantei]|uniref:Fe-S cluster assembly protein SufD n=1 Tax=Bradyrhizobium mercantei TaxID=1904807 RepID=UPI0009F9F8BB|nr:Fe-S cluster assembly protein SufD [Bradyrhizobium mercantei]
MDLVLAKAMPEDKANAERAASNVFAAAQGRLPGAGRIAAIRARAFEAYERVGLPHRRVEEWKYTDLRVLMRDVLRLAERPDASALKRAQAAVDQAAFEGAIKLVLVDGMFAPNLSDVAKIGKGIDVQTLREVLESSASDALAGLVLSTTTDAMISLNTAMATDGVVVTIAEGKALRRPLHVIHVSTTSSASHFTRSYLHLGDGAHGTVVESFVSAESACGYQANNVMIVLVGNQAGLSHLRVKADAADAVNISSEIIAVGSKAKLNLFDMIRGGAVSRYQDFITLAGEGAELCVNGVNLLMEKQHADTTLVVDHAAPHCVSRQNFRAVVDGAGRSVFQGRIIARPDAQKSDAKLTMRALLLSDQAEADNKPELEIFADDVKCGHGATSGGLDESLLFYLGARGLSENDAQALLIRAFLGEAIEGIANENLRDFATSQTERWFKARR